MGAGNTHLKLKISQEDATFEVVAFGLGSLEAEFAQAQDLELAVQLSVNQWNGQTTLNSCWLMRVSMVCSSSISALKMPVSLQVFPFLDFTKELPDLTGTSAVVVGNIPEDIEELRQIFKNMICKAVYFKNEISKAYYLTGYGSRDQYAKLYKTIYQYPEFDVRYKLKDLAAYLKIQQIPLGQNDSDLPRAGLRDH